jgi:uncharacterized membrane protein
MTGTSKRQLIAAAILGLTAIVSWRVYAALPETVASHWNAQGLADGYMTRFWGVWLMPILAAGFFLLLFFLPVIDPKRRNIEAFRPYYEDFTILFLAFFCYVHALTLLWNLGRPFDLLRLMAPAFGILFFGVAELISRAEPNWTIGIRTPWTLSNETVWRRTHVLGGRLFRAAALASFVGALFPRAAIWLILAPTVAAALISAIYSFFLYRRTVGVGSGTPRI